MTLNPPSAPPVARTSRRAFDSLRTGLDPSITAVATFLMVLSTGAVLAATYLRRGQQEQA